MGNYFTLKKINNENNMLLSNITPEDEKYILENSNVKDAIKIIEKFNKLYQNYKKYIELIINDKAKIYPNKNFSNRTSLLESDINIEENINNYQLPIKNKKSILQNIELRLYNLSFEYDYIICGLNTQYNKNVNKKNNNIENIKKIIDYIINLKNKEITPKILEIGQCNQFIEISMSK